LSPVIGVQSVPSGYGSLSNFAGTEHGKYHLP